MRLLFEIDTKDYHKDGPCFVRPSVRCVAIRSNKIAMVYSPKYDYYKFPGGGIEKNETKEEALIRETQEEAGLVVIPSSIEPYGYVHRVQKSAYKDTEYFIQDNFYYICGVEETLVSQDLDAYEQTEGFQLRWISAETAIQVNRTHMHGPKDGQMLEREARVLECLMADGYLMPEDQ